MKTMQYNEAPVALLRSEGRPMDVAWKAEGALDVLLVTAVPHQSLSFRRHVAICNRMPNYQVLKIMDQVSEKLTKRKLCAQSEDPVRDERYVDTARLDTIMTELLRCLVP